MIMKKIILFTIVTLMSFGATAQAKISFKSETVNFGTIAKGSDGVRVFEFTNTGNVPLIISEVKSSCDCTVPQKPDGPIAPGISNYIRVKYDTNRVGPIRKTITVYSNATEPIKALKIKGEVMAAKKSVLEQNK
jgi:hypothetical protein